MKKLFALLLTLCMLLSLGTAVMASGEPSGSEEAAAASLALTDPAWELSGDGSYYQLKNVVYCTNVINPTYQYMNIYVPAAYIDDASQTVNGYTSSTAPIVLENNCAGWNSSTPGGANKSYLAEGFVFVSVGARSRNAENGTGKMPAPVVDQKAAVRYLRLNDAVIPGDKDRIVSEGTSGGGQMSSILGATGNMDEYYPYLYEIGAAGVELINGEYISTIRDDIFASMCYCPIADLNNADLAYAWLRFDAGETGAMTMFSGEIGFSQFQLALQDDLAVAFAAYINSLGIKNEDGDVLSFDLRADGTPDPRSGSYYDQVLENISRALNAWLAGNTENGAFSYRASGEMYDSADAYIASLDNADAWLTKNADGTYAVTDLAGFLNGTGLARNKDIPGFDTFFATEEGDGFGTAGEDGVHFSASVAAVLAENYDRYAAMDGFQDPDVDAYIQQANRADIQEQTYLMNATRILLDVAAGTQESDIARHWRTRNGTADEHTSFSVAYNLCMSALAAGAEDVDYSLVWLMPHGSAEGTSTGTFVDWVHGICAEEAAASVEALPAEPSGEASASPEAPAAEEGTATVPDPLELIVPGIQYFDGATVGGEPVGGAFYVYGPENPHMYDMLSSFLNGVVYLYPDKPVTDETDALALIRALGLDEIAETFPAYIVIPVPVDGANWTEADLDVYWNSQFWLAGGEITFATEPPQGEYVRHTMNSLQYVLGEGSGATFVNNVLSQNAQRIAGIATFGGEIDADLPQGPAVPAYLVNPSPDAVAYWKAVNGTDADEGNVSYNSAYAQKKVITAEGGDSFDRANVLTAWKDLLSRTMRLGVGVNVVITTKDQSDWVLMDWLELSEIGLNLHSFEWNADRGEAAYYDEYETKSENSVQLYVPEAVEQNPAEAVPLVVVLHGMGDDPLNVVVGCGWAQKAVDENFILISPSTEDVDYIMGLIDYVDNLYAIDLSRIYVTGFSMGGANTSNVGKAHPEVFAAIAPMGAAGGSVVEGFDNEAYDLPTVMIVGSIDENNISMDDDGNAVITGIMGVGLESIDQAFEINGIDPGQRDYAANPFWGYTPDEYSTLTDKDLEWQFSDFYSEDYEHPVVELVTLVGAAHSNADYMATVAWDFLKNFSRAEDGSLIEN